MGELTLIHDYEKELHSLKAQNAELLEALEKIGRIAKDPNVRSKRTMFQMCDFLDEVILSIVEPAIAKAEGGE